MLQLSPETKGWFLNMAGNEHIAQTIGGHVKFTQYCNLHVWTVNSCTFVFVVLLMRTWELPLCVMYIYLDVSYNIWALRAPLFMTSSSNCQAGSFSGNSYLPKMRQLEHLSTLLIRRTESRETEIMGRVGDGDFNDVTCCICYACEADAQFVPCSHISCFGCISRHLLNCERCFFCNTTVVEVVKNGWIDSLNAVIFFPDFLSSLLRIELVVGDRVRVLNYFLKLVRIS